MSGVNTFARPGVNLSLHDPDGRGVPFLFQHGLCGSAAQTFEVMPQMAGLRRITLDCRGQGASEVGDLGMLSIATFTDDVSALIAQRQLGAVIAGGISMGAAIALRLAVTQPQSVRALVLARPAWVTKSAPDNMRPYVEVGELLTRYPAGEARRLFLMTDTAERLRREAPANFASLDGFFAREPLAVTAALLMRIGIDGPGVTPTDVARIACPVLIIGHGEDLAHPFAACEELASLIPTARLVRITSKVVDPLAHVSDFKAALAAFLKDLSDAKA